MPLSRKYNAQLYFANAVRDIPDDDVMTRFQAFEKFTLINRSVDTVAGLFYSLMSNAYMTPVTILPDTLGRYSSSGTGTWVASTRTLTFVGMNTDFGSGDVGKICVFRVGSLTYIAQVETFVSIDVITLTAGNNIPTSNQTVDYVILVSTPPTGNLVSIADLPIMRVGMPIKLELESTATDTVDPLSVAELRTWITTAPKNVNRVVWAYSGEELLLKKGSSLTTYGTFTLRYPRVPVSVASETAMIDLPDGPAIELGMIKLRMLIAARLRVQIPDQTNQIAGLIQSLYTMFGFEMKLEDQKEKISALQ